ncbi:acyclic terpene utilization AtuA family protein [Luteipulveratus mongoliensis]|uniref:acyclic terpene utilization AtuA family protein n=1 Tax=Luteipulveratus mongoliensis TaxID=571913 RepID=UPI0009F93610|nr:acyclic terpene utilization AtuA family protein [Luteipulveratus mongoliensis]
MTSQPIRIGNASGFYGDRFSAMREMLEGGELDVLTGDYLAELTMLILARDRMKDSSLGYAKTFLRQMEDCLGLALDRGVKIVTNAGGLNPRGLASAVRTTAADLGLDAKVAHVEGDDLTARADELGLGTPLAANAYLGAWGIVECLNAGADVVVTGRVTDASVIVGPAAAHFGWQRDEFDALAGAVAAGHVIECGTQATGGNFAFFREIEDLQQPGFPIAEISADGSSVITKHDGTGGAVTVDTVTAQLLYEVTGARYAGPDVTLRLDSVQLEQEAPDRVRLSGVRGEAPPPDLKVSLNSLGGFRNEVTFVLTGLDIEAKANLVKQQLAPALPEGAVWTLARTDKADAPEEETASALLRCVVRGDDQKAVGRSFSNAAVQLALGSYPGFHLTAPPADASPYGVFTAGFVAAQEVPHFAVLADGTEVSVAPSEQTLALADVEEPPSDEWIMGSTTRLPLGLIAGARSGDKGGDANIGVWVRDHRAWLWLSGALTVDLLRELLPEVRELSVTRHLLPNLRAVNFVVEGILGQGVASQVRFDPQAKALGEWLRSRHVDILDMLLNDDDEIARRVGEPPRASRIETTTAASAESPQTSPGLDTPSASAPGYSTNAAEAPGYSTNAAEAPGYSTNAAEAPGYSTSGEGDGDS